MTTSKTRCTIYLYDGAALDDLVQLARRALPLEARGRITRGTDETLFNVLARAPRRETKSASG